MSVYQTKNPSYIYKTLYMLIDGEGIDFLFSFSWAEKATLWFAQKNASCM